MTPFESVQRRVRQEDPNAIRSFLGRVRLAARKMNPRTLQRQHHEKQLRAKADQFLAEFSAETSEVWKGPVLVETMWDNPNFWIRYAMFRKAFGLSKTREIGLVGPFSQRECRQTLNTWGIQDVRVAMEYHGDMEKHRQKAQHLLRRTTKPSDVLSWDLPANLPGDMLFDEIIKFQRSATIDLQDPRLEGHVAECLGWAQAAVDLLASEPFTLVTMSHVVGTKFGPFALAAVQRGIPVVLLTGMYGSMRFSKLSTAAHLYDNWDCPTAEDLDSLSETKAHDLEKEGEKYLAQRRAGQTQDMGGIYAFKRASESIYREGICSFFGWDPAKPIIAIYASNWFDYPHTYGMNQFTDFLDWIESTTAEAVKNTSVNWLFKPHPVDDWYGGVTLKDMMPDASAPHVRLAPKQWNGDAVFRAVDGLVTYHGTSGIEYAGGGKPVLVGDRGWYHDRGFVKWTGSRESYLKALRRPWWKELDLTVTRKRALQFAGVYFCRAAWEDGFVFKDDSIVNAIYADLPGMITENPSAIERELTTLREWYASDHRFYQTFKIRQAEKVTC